MSAEVHRFPRKSEALDFIVHYLQIGRGDGLTTVLRGVGRLPFLERSRSTANLPASSRSDLRRHPRASCRFEGGNQPTGLGHSQHRHTGAGRSPGRPPSGFDASQHSHRVLCKPAGLCPICHRSSTSIRPEQTNYISFITGPSRTADIERVLTIGVHGPEKLIIVFVDQVFVNDSAGAN